jgi:glyoxylase-like metal-dependent hydrolase (beta-lactamase superfamily II)
MKLVSIIPECFKMDGGACFGVVPKSLWSKHVISDENNLVSLSSRCLLVDTGDRRILIDTGLGNKQSDKYYSYFHLFQRIGLEKALQQNGYGTSSITDVILTHLHFDHAGGAVRWKDGTQEPEAVFPNATYYCSKAQWDAATNPNPREKASYFTENYMPLFDEGRLEFIHEDGPFSDEIDLEIKNGHTSGLIVPIISYKNRKIVFTADFIATQFNIPLAYVPSFDVEPLKSMEEKEEFLTRAAENDYILFFEHDCLHECCNLETTEKGIRAGKSFTLNAI